MFVDRVKIYVKAGNGGRGCVSFHREKFAPRGGPDGGDGGKGGDVYLKSTEEVDDLSHLAKRLRYKAGNGGGGSGNNRSGKKGRDIIIPVPPGTMVLDGEKGELIHDFTKPEEHAEEEATLISPLQPIKHRITLNPAKRVKSGG